MNKVRVKVNVTEFFSKYWPTKDFQRSNDLVEVEAELVEEWPKRNDTVWTLSTNMGSLGVWSHTWHDFEWQQSTLKNGFAFKTREEAQALADHLLAAAREWGKR